MSIAVLTLLVAAQATYHFRDSIVTFWPVTRPPFEQFCAVAGCSIRPLRDAAMSHLSIEASDLQADPAHRGLLILTATLRNRATWPLAYPYLELTLTDAQDRVVVRRALAPADYAGGTTDLQKGIASNAEVALKFIDARRRRRAIASIHSHPLGVPCLNGQCAPIRCAHSTGWKQGLGRTSC